MKIFEFKVEDKDGLWGSLRVESESESAALETCRTTIANEALDEGNIDPKTATLTLISCVEGRI